MAEESPSYALEAAPPDLLYSLRKKPSAKQALMCSSAVDTHIAIDDLIKINPGDKESLNQNQCTIVNAFSVGGVQENPAPDEAMRQIERVQSSLFKKYYLPMIWRQRSIFLTKIIFVMLFEVVVGLIVELKINNITIANYIFMVAASGLGVVVASAGSLSSSYARFADDLETLRYAFGRLCIVSSLSVAFGFIITLGLFSVRLGTTQLDHFYEDTRIACGLGLLIGLVNLQVYELTMRIASKFFSAKPAGKNTKN